MAILVDPTKDLDDDSNWSKWKNEAYGFESHEEIEKLLISYVEDDSKYSYEKHVDELEVVTIYTIS